MGVLFEWGVYSSGGFINFWPVGPKFCTHFFQISKYISTILLPLRWLKLSKTD